MLSKSLSYNYVSHHRFHQKILNQELESIKNYSWDMSPISMKPLDSRICYGCEATNKFLAHHVMQFCACTSKVKNIEELVMNLISKKNIQNYKGHVVTFWPMTDQQRSA